MRPTTALSLITLLFAPAPLAAQNGGRAHLTFEVAAPGFRAGIRDTSTPPIYVRPFTPRMYTLRYTSGWFGIGLTYGSALSEARQNDLAVILPTTVIVGELAPEIRLPLWRNAAGTEFLAHIGPTFAVWGTTGYGEVTRIGGQAGASLLVPLAGRLSASFRGDLAVSNGHIADQRLDPDLSNHPLWRTRVGIGLSYRLTSGD